MSDPIRVALAVEGPTDHIVLRAAIRSLLSGREVVFSHLQPLVSAAFQPVPGALAGRWGGVYLWCRQAAAEGGGQVSQSAVFLSCDILVVQVDADVAGMTYASTIWMITRPIFPAINRVLRPMRRPTSCATSFCGGWAKPVCRRGASFAPQVRAWRRGYYRPFFPRIGKWPDRTGNVGPTPNGSLDRSARGSVLRNP